MCDDVRSVQLQRACDSVRAMAAGHHYSIIVVANGPRVSPALLGRLSAEPDVRVLQLRSGSYPMARRVGAEIADGEFLAFLDDDDELLPNTFGAKLEFFHRHPDVDVLVTDGLRVNGTTVTRVFPPPAERSPDLIETMIRSGWGACAITLRRQNVDLAAFDPAFRHLEWTLTTLELASRYRVGFLDEPTYRYYEDTPGSLSKNPERYVAPPELWRRLSQSYAGTRYASIIRRRYGVECHQVAQEYARHGQMREAWRLHVESMRSPGGLAFIPFSAKLLIGPLQRRLSRELSPRASPSSVA